MYFNRSKDYFQNIFEEKKDIKNANVQFNKVLEMLDPKIRNELEKVIDDLLQLYKSYHYKFGFSDGVVSQLIPSSFIKRGGDCTHEH